MAKWSKDYKFFVVTVTREDTPIEIVAGNEYREDAAETKSDLPELKYGRKYKIYTRKTCETKGLL